MRFLWVFVVGLFLTVNPLSSTNLHAQAEPGGSCHRENEFYHYVSDLKKTPWEINEILAVPAEIIDPYSWDYAASFRQRFLSLLGVGRSAQEFAEACVLTWQDYPSASVKVMVDFRRDIGLTDSVLECISGTWILQSTQLREMRDVSDWLVVTEAPPVPDSSSISVIRQGLENKLNSLNNQPGALSQPESPGQ